MAIASPVVVSARALAGAASETSGAVPSRDLRDKVWSCGFGNSRQCFVYRGESWSHSWRHSTIVAKGERSSRSSCRHLQNIATQEVRRTRPRIKAKVEDIETENLEVDYDIEPKRPLRPVVERFNIYHEKNICDERLEELGVSRWSKWDCGPGVSYFWQWKVDELVYISKGSVEVVPDGCYDGAFFYAGDLVRFPKWFEASLTFDEDYEQCYKFLAYGD